MISNKVLDGFRKMVESEVDMIHNIYIQMIDNEPEEFHIDLLADELDEMQNDFDIRLYNMQPYFEPDDYIIYKNILSAFWEFKLAESEYYILNYYYKEVKTA